MGNLTAILENQSGYIPSLYSSGIRQFQSSVTSALYKNRHKDQRRGETSRTKEDMQ
jgi:hypothetical protein